VSPDLLNLAGYEVLAVDTNEHDYHIKACVIAAQESCIHCQSSSIVGFGRREQMVRDLPTHGKRVGVYIDTRRFQCRACVKTFYEELPQIDEKRAMTKRLSNWIGRQAIKRTFASIAEEVGCTEFTVRSVFADYVQELEKTIRFETPKWMGIDEIHLIKPRGVITNIQNNTVVELLPNRNKETIIKYLSGLRGKEEIAYVAMDMWAPYRDAVLQVLPDAKIVIDKFHVVKMANEAVERIRKSFKAELTPKVRRTLMHDRYTLLKRESDLTDKEALLLSGWANNFPTLALAYRLKEDFFKIYDAKTRNDALALFAAWEISVTHEVRDAFGDLIRAWRNWRPYILNYFDHPVNQPITNAYTESLNNLIRVMNRLGRGYSFEALRAKILFSEGALKKDLKRPKFERQAERFSRDIPAFAMGYALANNSTANEEEICYGADISTLTRMIEAGEI
jgi:transposase